MGDRGSTVVKVLCYNSEGWWFDPSWCQWIFHWHKIPLIALWSWGRPSLWQKWIPGEFPGGKGGRCVRLTTYHHPVLLSRNLGTLISWNPQSLPRPVMGLLYLLPPMSTHVNCLLYVYGPYTFLLICFISNRTYGRWIYKMCMYVHCRGYIYIWPITLHSCVRSLFNILNWNINELKMQYSWH